MSKKFIKLSIVLISFCVLLPVLVGAAPTFDQGRVIADSSTLPIQGTSPVARIVQIIQVSLSFLGAITTIVLVYSGFLFAFSGGNPSTVDKARKTLTWALIGMLIVLASWAMTSFVSSSFSSVKDDKTKDGTTYVCHCVLGDDDITMGAYNSSEDCSQKCICSPGYQRNCLEQKK